jgi:hypothetical protein
MEGFAEMGVRGGEAQERGYFETETESRRVE